MAKKLLAFIIVGLGPILGYYIGVYNTSCPEQHLPTQVTDMFTVVGDTVYLKQDTDFIISTRGIILDTAGIIHRQK